LTFKYFKISAGKPKFPVWQYSTRQLATVMFTFFDDMKSEDGFH